MKLDALTGRIFDASTKNHCETLKSKGLEKIHRELKGSADFKSKLEQLLPKPTDKIERSLVSLTTFEDTATIFLCVIVANQPAGGHNRVLSGPSYWDFNEMGFISLDDDIRERRIENKALLIEEALRYRAAADNRLSPAGEDARERADALGMSRSEFIRMRDCFHRITAESNARLASESAYVFTLDRELTKLLKVVHVTKLQASEMAHLVPGDVLDIDNSYGGLMVQRNFVVASESFVLSVLDRFGPTNLLNNLFRERAS